MTMTDDLVALAEDAELWHDTDKRGFATIPVNDHRENVSLRSNSFRHWLGGRYFEGEARAASRSALDAAVETLSAKSIYAAPERSTAFRLAQHDGAIFIDLADADWRAIKVTAQGWEVVSRTPVRFLRSPGMRSLPMPEHGASIDQLRPFVNVGCEEDFRLLAGWLVAALRPGVPVPVLVLNGEAGSAKSTTTRVLRQLTDPKEPAIYSPPREDRDLVSAARHNAVLAFDNLSHIDQRLSDALCRLCTGGGQGGRKLFTDDEEATFEAKRPIIINGIPDLATYQDLASRSIVIALPPIPTERRKSESSFWEAFEAVRPKLFGCLLDALSCAIRRQGTVMLESRPRMADFLEFATAAEEALGWSDGSLLVAYRQNEMRANEIAIDSDLVAVALCQLVDHVDTWEGTATELQTALRIYGGDFAQDRRLWPQAPNKLSGRVRRAAPALRKIGIEVDYARRGAAGQTVFDIRKVPESILSTLSIVSNAPEPSYENGRKQTFQPSTDDTEGTDDRFMYPNTWGV